MSLIYNIYDLLDNYDSESDFESESVLEHKDINVNKPELVLNKEKIDSNLLINESESESKSKSKSLINLKPQINLKLINTVNENDKNINIKSTDETNVIKKKQPQNKNSPKKYYDLKNNFNIKIYNENVNLPIDIDAAINKKQNLTLKQILVLMKLQGIPWMVLNNIHDYLQKKIKRRRINITHGSRTFDVSYYNWYNLKQIEIMINSLMTPI